MTAEISTRHAGRVVAITTAKALGPATSIELVRGVGSGGDIHAGDGYRQIGLLDDESTVEVPDSLSSFGEHVRTRGLSLEALADGRRLRAGERAVLQVTARERLHSGERARGENDPWLVRAKVLRGGALRVGDAILTDPAFDRPRVAVITLSDRSAAGTRPDDSGPLAGSLLGEGLGTPPLSIDVLPDDGELLKARLVALADDEVCDLIVTTGGTGLSPRDVAPEATLAVIEREVPGIAEAIRSCGLSKTPFAMLSRAVCGQRGATLIVNLSGSPKAVREQLAVLLPVLPHALATSSGVPQSCGESSGHGRP